MRQIYYKSDFELPIDIRNGQGESVGVPDFTWTVKLYTEGYKGGGYTIGYDKDTDTWINCKATASGVTAIIHNHHMGVGALKGELMARLTDADYPQGEKTEMTLADMGVLLTAGENAEGLRLSSTGGVKGKKPFVIDKRIRRGLLPYHAEKGIVYRKDSKYPGVIVKIYLERDGVLDGGEWSIDMTRFARYGIEVVAMVVKNCEGGTDTRYVKMNYSDLVWHMDGKALKIDNALMRQKLEDGETLGQVQLHVAVEKDNETDVCYISEDGYLLFAQSIEIDAADYCHSISEREATGRFYVGHKDLHYHEPCLAVRVKDYHSGKGYRLQSWRHHSRNGDNIIPKKRFCYLKTTTDEANDKSESNKTIHGNIKAHRGVWLVQRRTHKGYTSRWVKVSVKRVEWRVMTHVIA